MSKTLPADLDQLILDHRAATLAYAAAWHRHDTAGIASASADLRRLLPLLLDYPISCGGDSWCGDMIALRDHIGWLLLNGPDETPACYAALLDKLAALVLRYGSAAPG